MRGVALYLLVAVPVAGAGAGAGATSPEASVRAALADCRKLPADRAARARYLSAYHLHDREELNRLDVVLRFVVNVLSTETELVAPVRVRPDLWRVYEDDYGAPWEKAWQKLKDAESFYHVKAVILADVYETVEVPYGYYLNEIGQRISRNDPTWTPQSKWVTTSVKTEKKLVKRRGVQAGAAPWVAGAGIADLIRLAQSESPVVRADWWVWQVMAQEGRAAGYYDFLGFKDEKEFQDLGGVNLKASQKLKLELRNVVGRSTVTLNSREIEWHAALTGSYFRSNDYDKSVDAKNPLRLLDGDAKPDAHEEYIRLPNGLWGVGLFAANGNRANTAPDFIASDGKARGTDRRVHVGISCFRCHDQGLQPVNDWAKRIYTAPFALESPEYNQQKRLRAIYLRDTQRVIDRQNVEYAEVVKGLTGLAPKEVHAALAQVYERYELEDRTLADAARELGLTEQEWGDKLKAAARAERRLDPVLAAMHQGLPVRFEQFEEVYAQAKEIAGVAP